MPFPNRPLAIDKNPAASELPVQRDPRIDPDGMYTGMTKRIAISDGRHCEVTGDVAKDYRNKSRLSED